MAVPPPDPKTLKTWEEAFTYSLPVVRQLEHQLRSTITTNSQKLRTHVGTSYRSLLSTAERIIEMDEQIRIAEGHMSEIGRKCNARSVEGVKENWGRMKNAEGMDGKEKWKRIANLRFLQGTVEVVGRIVRRGGDALLAAKVLILGRLVLKSFEEEEGEGKYGGLLSEFKKRLGGMRRKVLGYVSRIVVKVDVDKDVIVKALSAYSLIATSSPREVLRYFLQARLEQLQNVAEEPSEQDLLRTLDLYGQTLIDTRELFPRRLGESLSRLSDTALLQDHDVSSAHELSLDVYGQWIAEDVRNFHPWVRHDQLSTSDVQSASSSWSRQAQSCVLQALKECLGSSSDALTVLQLRHKVIVKYLSLSAKLGSKAEMQALNDLRTAFLSRLETLASDAAALSIHIPGNQAYQHDSHRPDTWELVTAKQDLAGGAIKYRTAIVQAQHGRGSSTDEAIEVLDAWMSRLHRFSEALATMRATKWDDNLELDLDDLADDEPLQVVLSKHDSKRLEEKLHQATVSSLQDLYTSLESSSKGINSSPALLIRVLREIDQRRRDLGYIAQGVDSIKPNDIFVAQLHTRLAAQVVEKPIERFAKKLQQHEHVAIALWDGTPQLPTQPSPATFRFLKMLHSDMSQLGTDLWSPRAVRTLKQQVAKRLDEEILVHTIDRSFGLPLSNGHASADPSDVSKGDAVDEQEFADDATNQRLTQRLFDTLYLQHVFVVDGAAGSQFMEVADRLQSRLSMDSAARERMEKSANEYWRRTYLLFGLFASRQAH